MILMACTIITCRRHGSAFGEYGLQSVFNRHHTGTHFSDAPQQQCVANTGLSATRSGSDVFSFFYDLLVSNLSEQQTGDCSTKTKPEAVQEEDMFNTLARLDSETVDGGTASVAKVLIAAHVLCLASTVVICVPALLQSSMRWHNIQVLSACAWSLVVSGMVSYKLTQHVSGKVAEVVCMHTCAAYLYLLMQSLRKNTQVRAAISWPPSLPIIAITLAAYCYAWGIRGPIVARDALLFYSLHVVGVLAASCVRALYWGTTSVICVFV